ncbi:hypothetical protein Rsub_12452 [Raphidocelis subcapitata]|uniref:Uncharacterized protein n=1 Tax=Raphidocelis subcapitata TaxID=307507 RepID=A0A2V0PHA0_9CHLO|nr:hypothetical protein Rsub_12452 [Raphidocelis subcapitata]|eukprot:GBF99194.1 hypothetical protein Rsub_12452 [Raphidocelis subcapitata]
MAEPTDPTTLSEATLRIERAALDPDLDDAIDNLPWAIGLFVLSTDDALKTKAVRAILTSLRRIGPDHFVKSINISLLGMARGDGAMPIDIDLEFPAEYADVYVSNGGTFSPAASLERILGMVIRAPPGMALTSLPSGFREAPPPEAGRPPRGAFCTLRERMGLKGSSRTATTIMVNKAAILTTLERCLVLDASEGLLRQIALACSSLLRDHPYAVAGVLRCILTGDPAAEALASLTAAAAPRGDGGDATGGDAAAGAAGAIGIVSVRGMDRAKVDLLTAALAELKGGLKSVAAPGARQVGEMIAASLVRARSALETTAAGVSPPGGGSGGGGGGGAGPAPMDWGRGTWEELAAGSGDDELAEDDTQPDSGEDDRGGGSRRSNGGGSGGGGSGGGGIGVVAAKLESRRLAQELGAALVRLAEERAARELAQEQAAQLQAALAEARRECQQLQAAAHEVDRARLLAEQEVAALRAAGAGTGGGGTGSSGSALLQRVAPPQQGLGNSGAVGATRAAAPPPASMPSLYDKPMRVPAGLSRKRLLSAKP